MQESLGNVLILGDSYSTYEGYIPEGNAIYYRNNGNETNGGLSSVEKTWWHQLITETGSRLVLNDSWSGSTVCLTGYDGFYCSASGFVNRVQRELIDGMCAGERVDTVIVFGGTNDSWAGSPIGTVQYADWDDAALRQFLPAFCFLMAYLREKNPGLRVINVINTDLKPEITDGMTEICRHYGVECVRLRNIEKQDGHPNVTGMRQIADQIRQSIAHE